MDMNAVEAGGIVGMVVLAKECNTPLQSSLYNANISTLHQHYSSSQLSTMRLYNILSTAGAVLHLLGKTQAKAVFAHYMVFSTTSPPFMTMLTSIESSVPWIKTMYNKTSTTQ